ncbi:hypothetical protein RHMOL_Rhmol12G0196900 [Rhododendron molle]|uniref:Uncharacterized protein n=1 Tax=Rhododendron molle TaxID=49168 RepID=A0ACC0LJW0_RHOML|nr:hypothetical protein RHMOL_Rhmol12G0196900 [Rhododendron molle]
MPSGVNHALLYPTSKLDSIASVSRFDSDSFVPSSLVHINVKCSQLNDAHKLLDGMSKPEVVSWIALVSGYARVGHEGEAKEGFEDMEKEGSSQM